MLPPIEPGTLLNQRYRVTRLFAQAEFYRTYLASDEGRFNEACTLEELSLNPQATPEVRSRSTERFQKESSRLYRLQHRQLPQVQATFEGENRLFLVLSHFEGQTLRELLRVRQSHNATFGEAEVRQLLESLLPVLDYLHRHNIIHGNITPQTIVLRSSSGVSFEETEGEAVLIHFGAIADLAHRFQSVDGESLSTVATQPGYAPPEQRQTGTVNFASDLYSLAATAVVLLTGREPAELCDPATQTWQWQSKANVSPEFAAVLDKMLAPQASDRYPDVPEVLQALEPSPAPIPTAPPSSPAPPPPPTAPVAPKNAASEMATQAVGGRQEPVAKKPEPAQREPFIPQQSQESLVDSPWFLGGLTVLLALVAGVGAWGLVTMLFKPQPETAVPAPTETIAESPSPTPEETPSSTPTPPTRRIRLLGGESFSDRGRLVSDGIVNYVIPAEAEQRLQAAVESEGVVLKILSPDGNTVAADASLVKNWEGSLPQSGDYTVQLLAVAGSPESDYGYQLNLRLDDALEPIPSPTISPSPSPSPAATPTPSPQLSYDREPVFIPFDSPGEPLELQGQTSPTTVKRYLVAVETGQILQVAVLQGQVSLDVRFPDSQFVEEAEGVQLWEGEIIQGGQYQIDVISDRDREFTLSLVVRDGQ
ncbi:MAG: serine/threonine-protein kinase [Cyanobacteriota bacterium]|nr:serine/threonine-protein kinase [Cyanobacteriota bacterium]